MKNTNAYLTTMTVMGIIAALTLVYIAPVSTSATTLTRQLEIGMTGSDVTELQTYLASDSTLYPEGLITGYFGPLTRAAVMRYQARFGIPQVGRVGPQTLAAIGNLADTTRKVGSDRSVPVISNVNVSTTNSSATITLNTSQAASAVVYYDVSPLRLTEADATNGVTISGISTLVHTNLTTSHTATLTGLQSNTTYNYLVYVQDASGNVSVTWPTTFRTN